MAARKTTKSAEKTKKVSEVKAAEVKGAEVKAAEVKDAEVKAAEPEAEEIKAEQKVTETKAASAKKTTAASKKTEGAAAKRGPKKAELKQKLYLQYGGKAYGQEDLLKMAKDVWKYDLKRKVGELTSVDLYVKPEENKVYYVMNGEFTGSFDI